MNPKVDKYIIDGCMRCKFGGTPECKVNNWRDELKKLRSIILDCGLKEELKWGVPCYTLQSDFTEKQEKNIAIVSAFKEFCAISFFKGALLTDTHNLLVKPGENSQAGRYLRFTDVKEILENEEIIKAYIFEAIEIEEAGLKVEFKKNAEPVPDELLQKFEEDSYFKSAFDELTPGRQKGYILHFSQPKQSKTRYSRIERCTGKILNGKGLNDR